MRVCNRQGDLYWSKIVKVTHSRLSLIIVATLLSLRSSTTIADILPTTPQFMNVIAACGAGIGIKINADIKGSVQTLYEESKTEGKASQEIVAQVLDRLPIEKKELGYTKYVECIIQLLAPKADASVRVLGDIKELSLFPDLTDLPQHKTMLQSLLVYKPAEKLFTLLSRYNYNEITLIEGYGSQLEKYKEDYYNYEERQLSFEELLVQKIGAVVAVRFPAGWAMYLRYILLRENNSVEQIKAWGDFFNYDITWADAERVNTQLNDDPALAQEKSQLLRMRTELASRCQEILAALR